MSAILKIHHVSADRQFVFLYKNLRREPFIKWCWRCALHLVISFLFVDVSFRGFAETEIFVHIIIRIF